MTDAETKNDALVRIDSLPEVALLVFISRTHTPSHWSPGTPFCSTRSRTLITSEVLLTICVATTRKVRHRNNRLTVSTDRSQYCFDNQYHKYFEVTHHNARCGGYNIVRIALIL
jgi:hypothetical protein